MHKVINIKRSAVTSFITMVNLDTGTEDYCFDDSKLVNEGFEDFDFMKEGCIYDCKISLMGKFVSEETEKAINITKLEKGAVIGKTLYWKATINNDVYYIFETEMDNYDPNRPLLYLISRKDLIQVNDIIHADCLL